MRRMEWTVTSKSREPAQFIEKLPKVYHVVYHRGISLLSGHALPYL